MCDEAFLEVNAIFETLCRSLSSNSDVNKVSSDFHVLKSNPDRVDFSYDLLKKYRLFPKPRETEKDDRLSVRFRQDGNDLYKEKKHSLAWTLYTKSILHAEKGSEVLGLAYANRSAVLFERRLYKECLHDVRKALASNYPKNLHDKLTQRQTKANSLAGNQRRTQYYEEPPNVTQANPVIQCASRSVRMKYTPNLGRHIVASKDIKVGDVIAVEKPYAKILLAEHFTSHCFNCLSSCFTLIPCDNCTNVLYCSEACKQSAWEQFHRYDCPILRTLQKLGTSKLTLLALRIAICTKSEYKNVQSYKESYKTYKSDRYEEIHNLMANSDSRSNADLFQRSVTAAVLFNLVENRTSFFDDFEDKMGAKCVFKELVLRHMQTGPTNFHEISELAERAEDVFETEETGAGAYSFMSLLNHSCAPNVVRHCHGSEIVLRALRPIPNGQQLFDNYGYHHAVMKKLERQFHLKQQYFFNCNCEACENNWPLYQSLPVKQCYFELSESQIESLKRGDPEVAKSLLKTLTDKATIIENIRPCRNLADIQESIKQCYAIFGNKRLML